MNEEYEALKNKVASGTCTNLELYNIKMYLGIQAIGREGLARVIDKELASIKEEMEKRIHISRWPQGTHYYAKADNKDVVDENGEVKWNTHGEAMRAAKNFINNCG